MGLYYVMKITLDWKCSIGAEIKFCPVPGGNCRTPTGPSPRDSRIHVETNSHSREGIQTKGQRKQRPS